VKIYFDDNTEHPSVAISGSITSLLAFAQALRDEKEIAFVCDQGPSTPYPRLLNKLVFKRTNEVSIGIAVEHDELILSGNTQSANNLAQSIENIFHAGASHGTHFHLDYFDFSEDNLLAPTKFGLIFQLEND